MGSIHEGSAPTGYSLGWCLLQFHENTNNDASLLPHQSQAEFSPSSPQNECLLRPSWQHHRRRIRFRVRAILPALLDSFSTFFIFLPSTLMRGSHSSFIIFFGGDGRCRNGKCALPSNPASARATSKGTIVLLCGFLYLTHSPVGSVRDFP